MLNDASLNEGQSLYHFLPWPYAQSIFRNGGLRLNPVQSWTDPYERAWCRLLFEHGGKLNGVNAYGLCLTKSRYDEPSWRMAAFSRNDPIVRIRCNVKTILDAGCNLIQKEEGSLFLGEVRYVREKTLYVLAQSVKDKEHQEVSHTAAGLLLQKRNAFRFEQEVRLMWFDRAPVRDSVLIPIEAKIAITQVMTSPYATDKEHESIGNALKPYGIKLKRSGLLSEPGF